MSNDTDELLACVAAITHALQGPFDPRSVLAEFSARLQSLLPHDRVMIVHREEGESLSVLAEQGGCGPAFPEGRYTLAFDPGGRYPAANLGLSSVLAGETTRCLQDFRDGRQGGPWGPDAPSARRAGLRSSLGAPLRSGRSILGALVVGSVAPDTYGEGHAVLAQRVADVIAPFIENTVLLCRERRRRDRLAAVVELGRVVGASLCLTDTFAQVANAVRPLMDFDAMGVSLLGENGRDLHLIRRVSGQGLYSIPSRIPLNTLSFSTSIEGGCTLLLRDARLELDTARPGDRRIVERGNRACLSVPLWLGKTVGGVLFFAKRRPDWYDGSDIEVAAAIAAQIVLTLEHQRLAEAQQRRAKSDDHARRPERRSTGLQRRLDTQYGFEQIIGRAPALREALGRALKVAPTDTTVLLTGESGTGKELVARAIHQASLRAEGPFVAINCATIPETLVESELFGHEKGAFTGADRQKPGLFETAAAGTLFLDEVAELPLSAQAKLLRVLQEHEFQRVGGTATLRAEARLIVATNRDLAQAVRMGAFREDLFYRVSVFRVHLPPLRERGDDILRLADHFVRALGPRTGRGEPGLSRDARTLLLSYRWPGNIRELENAVERALIIAEGGLLTAEHFGPLGAGNMAGNGTADRAPAPAASACLAEVEKDTILAALERAKGNKARAAAALGITRTKLYTRLKRFGFPL